MTTTPEGHEAPTPIPTPPDFPVTWEDTEDEGRFWQADPMHFPEPVTPIMESVLETFNDGFRLASMAYEMPITIKSRRINTYIYNTVLPMVPPEEMEARGKRAEANLKPAMGRLWELWSSELLPEFKEFLAFWEAFDLRHASMPALLAHLDETWDKLKRQWEIHFLVAFPFILAPSLFQEIYQELFEKDRGLDAYRLLQGFGNKTVEGDHALWALSRKALASPEVYRILTEKEIPEVVTALENSPEARDFLEEFRAYLEEYGQRSDVFAEIGHPGWIEDPTTPIGNLKAFLAQPDRDLPAELVALAEERESSIAQARADLKGYPQPVKEQFEFLLKAAQEGTIIQEDHNHWMDQRGIYKVRLVLLEFGRRFADAGMIEDSEDVVYLTDGELKETASRLPQGDRREIVAQRRAKMNRFREIHPPPVLGTQLPGPPPDDPMGRAMGRFFSMPPQEPTEPGVIKGNAGSPGKARGPARLVLSLAEAGKLQKGDILVAPSTMPAWTPLFGIASAVVTDAGGVLSHCAIVAREYNIPAVIGTGRATSSIQDGQMLEVDGDAGEVRIL